MRQLHNTLTLGEIVGHRMKLQTIIICLLVTITLGNCSVGSSDIETYKGKFYAHKNTFNNIVTRLRTENIKVGFTVNENELSADVQKILAELGIKDINTSMTTCNGVVEYQFTSIWSSNATLYFSKNECNKQQSKTGFHSKMSEMIEVWGLGNDWIMWIDYDTI
jgi:hypothetical protein